MQPMVLPDSWYNCLKFLCTIFLPALGTLYFSLAQIWDLPLAEQVTGTICAISVFIGAIINISSKNYYKDGKIQPPDEETENTEP